MTVTSFVRATAAAGIALLVAGCTGSADGSETSAASSTSAAATTSSSTSSAPPTTTTSTSATTQSMAEKYPETPAGAEAFVRAYWSTYDEACQKPSKVPDLKSLAQPECASCKRLSDEIEGWVKKGAHQSGPSARVLKLKSESETDPGVVFALVDQLPGNVVTADGKVIDKISAQQVKMAMTLTWTDSGWKVARIQPYEGEL